MLSNSALISTFLLACSVLAAPSPEHYQARTLDRVERSTNAAHEYSHNNAGASLTGKTVDYITGSFLAPSVTGESGSAFLTYVSLSCPDTTFLAGVQFQVTEEGTKYQSVLVSPLNREPFMEDITISPEHLIEISVDGTSATGVSLEVKNHSTGKVVSETYMGSTRCTQTANLFVQNTTDDPLPNFGTVEITGKAAGNGQTYTIQKVAFPVDIEGQAQTTISGDIVTVTYV